MEIDGKTGLIIAAVAGGAALLLGKKSKTAKCPAGSKLDKASGKCIYTQTVEVQVAAPAGSQKNAGGPGDTGAVLSYDYNLQMLAQWKKAAAALSEDAKATTEFGALMVLLEMTTMFPDTAAGRASVDKLNVRIQDAFKRIDDARARAAEDRAAVVLGDSRNALALKYDAAAASALSKFTEIGSDLRGTFLTTREIVDYYSRALNNIIPVVLNLYFDYNKVVGVVNDWDRENYAATRLPAAMKAALPSFRAFSSEAGSLAGISVPGGNADAVLAGAPLVFKQLEALQTNFVLRNTWGATASGLKNFANPGAAAATYINYRQALQDGMGALYCGRAAAILTAIPTLTEVEMLLNRLEIVARALDAGLEKIWEWVNFADSAVNQVNGGDGWNSTTQMSALINRLNASDSPCARFCGDKADCSQSANRSYDYIRQQAAEFLPRSCYNQTSDGSRTVGPLVPSGIEAALKGIDLSVPATATQMFTKGSAWGLPDATTLQGQLQAIATKLADWLKGTSILTSERENAAPDAGEFTIDLSIVAYCASSSVPFADPIYASMPNEPNKALIAQAPLPTDADATWKASAQVMKDQMAVAYTGLRGLGAAPSSRVAVRETGSGRGQVAARAIEPLRVSVAERVAVRGSDASNGLGQLGRSTHRKGCLPVPKGGGLGGLGHLGDPIQSILSPLMGLSGKRRR